MTAAAEAKHLDSVTDHVQEQELDEGRVTSAMSALSINKSTDANGSGVDASSASTRTVSKEDIAFIVEQLECTNEVAEKALRDVVVEDEENSSAIVGAALRLLITT